MYAIVKKRLVHSFQNQNVDNNSYIVIDMGRSHKNTLFKSVPISVYNIH